MKTEQLPRIEPCRIRPRKTPLSQGFARVPGPQWALATAGLQPLIAKCSHSQECVFGVAEIGMPEPISYFRTRHVWKRLRGTLAPIGLKEREEKRERRREERSGCVGRTSQRVWCGLASLGLEYKILQAVLYYCTVCNGCGVWGPLRPRPPPPSLRFLSAAACRLPATTCHPRTRRALSHGRVYTMSLAFCLKSSTPFRAA